MIRLENVTKEFPDKTLFKDVSLSVKSGIRIGLVGPNGSGKTTLLRLMLGKEPVDEGIIRKDKAQTIGYLPQDIVVGSGISILEKVLLDFPEVVDLERKMEKVLKDIAEHQEDGKLLKKLGEYQEKYDRLNGWSLETRAKKFLGGLGFQPDQFDKPMETFSGGWRMRVVLAGILLQNPDFLFLDEPTNHLDLEATIWLEEFLREWKGGLIVISHDRAFLDRSVNYILEIEKGRLRLYTGNYTQYRKQKEDILEQQRAAYRNQQKKIAETRRFIERFRYKNTKARQVQSRIKQLEKMDLIDAPEFHESRLHVRIPQPDRGPVKVVSLTKVQKAYGDLKVYEDLNLTLERGQKIGLVGINGAGKSTLLKLLAGVEPVTGGSIEYGPDIQRAYFAQHQLEVLNPDHTVFETIEELAPGWSISQIKGYLGSFLFSGETVEKLVKVLSGGEKSRLAFAKMLVKPSHLLLLDEPTNHLDMNSRDVVEKALQEFQGSIVCISHDRHFLNAVTNIIIEITMGDLFIYHGNYEYYEWKKTQRDRVKEQSHKPAQEAAQVQDEMPGKKKQEYKTRKRMRNRARKIEMLLEDIDRRLTVVKENINDPAIASDFEALQEALNKEKELEEKYLLLMNELVELESSLT